MFSYTNLDVRLIHLYNHYLHHKSYSTEYNVHLSMKSHTRRNNVLHPLEMKCLKTFGFISNMSRYHPFNSIQFNSIQFKSNIILSRRHFSMSRGNCSYTRKFFLATWKANLGEKDIAGSCRIEKGQYCRFLCNFLYMQVVVWPAVWLFCKLGASCSKDD